MAILLELRINGSTHRVEVDPERSLLSVLRDDLGFTGTKYGCGEGQCGACTVLLDGAPARSCLTSIELAAGKAITTIEGIEEDGKLHPVQQAFLDADSMQCGYCTSGMIVSAVGLLQKQKNPSVDEIRRAMHGNLCRCGCYGRIITALQMASKKLQEKLQEERR